MAKIINPKELREKETGYDFLKFWHDFTDDDRVWEEYDGGSCMKWGVRRDLRGLCRVCYHYIFSRGNSTGQITLKQMIDYVAQRDRLFAERVKSQRGDIPDITLRKWADAVINKDDKKLRKMLGLKE